MIDNEIADIQQRLENARIAKIKAETEMQLAQSKLDEAMTELKVSFDIDNLDQLRAKLAELQTNLQDQLESMRTQLDEIES